MSQGTEIIEFAFVTLAVILLWPGKRKRKDHDK